MPVLWTAKPGRNSSGSLTLSKRMMPDASPTSAFSSDDGTRWNQLQPIRKIGWRGSVSSALNRFTDRHGSSASIGCASNLLRDSTDIIQSDMPAAMGVW
jgi:hypothetical protein